MPYFFLNNHLLSGNEPIKKRSENKTQETSTFKPSKRMRRSNEQQQKQNRRRKQMASQKPKKKKSSRTRFHEEGMPEEQEKNKE